VTWLIGSRLINLLLGGERTVKRRAGISGGGMEQESVRRKLSGKERIGTVTCRGSPGGSWGRKRKGMEKNGKKMRQRKGAILEGNTCIPVRGGEGPSADNQKLRQLIDNLLREQRVSAKVAMAQSK